MLQYAVIGYLCYRVSNLYNEPDAAQTEDAGGRVSVVQVDATSIATPAALPAEAPKPADSAPIAQLADQPRAVDQSQPVQQPAPAPTPDATLM